MPRRKVAYDVSVWTCTVHWKPPFPLSNLLPQNTNGPSKQYQMVMITVCITSFTGRLSGFPCVRRHPRNCAHDTQIKRFLQRQDFQKWIAPHLLLYSYWRFFYSSFYHLYERKMIGSVNVCAIHLITLTLSRFIGVSLGLFNPNPTVGRVLWLGCLLKALPIWQFVSNPSHQDWPLRNQTWCQAKPKVTFWTFGHFWSSVPIS